MAIYYVSTTGSDSAPNDGSLLAPWRTCTKAEATAADDDTVNIADGIFEEASTWTIAKRIAWVGAGRTSTFIRAVNATRLLYLNSTKTKSLTDLTIDGSSSGATPAYLLEGGAVNQATTFTRVGFKLGKTTTLRITAGMTGITLTDCVIDANTETQVAHLLGGAIGLTLQGVTINVPAGLVMNGVIYQAAAATSGTITINQCPITVLSNYSPIRLIGGGLVSPTITNNPITVDTNNQRSIIDLVDIVTSCNVSGNTITIPGTSDLTLPIKCTSTVGTGPDCVYTIEDNIIESHNPDGYGILLGDEGGDVTSKAGAFNGSIIRNNTLRFPPYFAEAIGSVHGIMMGGNINIYYEGNTIVGAAYGAACKGQGEAWTAGYIRRNKFINCDQGIRYKGQKNIRAANNVVIGDNGDVGQGLYATDNTVGGSESTGSFTCNHIYSISTGYAVQTADTSHTGMTHDYNCFNLSGTAKAGLINGVTYNTLADLQAAGYDTHSVSGNPNMAADYTVAAGSICFEKGLPVAGLTDCADSTGSNLIVLAGAATFSLDSPYKNRVPIS